MLHDAQGQAAFKHKEPRQGCAEGDDDGSKQDEYEEITVDAVMDSGARGTITSLISWEATPSGGPMHQRKGCSTMAWTVGR